MKILSRTRFKLYNLSKRITEFLERAQVVKSKKVVESLDKQLEKDLKESEPDLSNLDENSFVHKYLASLGFWEDPEVQYAYCRRFPKLLNLL